MTKNNKTMILQGLNKTLENLDQKNKKEIENAIKYIKSVEICNDNCKWKRYEKRNKELERLLNMGYDV